jgi:PKD repeat protein
MLSETIGIPIPQKVEIPLFVKGEGDGKFDSGDAITFYGFSYATWINNVWTKNYYEDKNVYWLTWGGVNGKRMATKNVAPSGGSDPGSYHQIIHLEEDHETASIGTLDYRDQVIWAFSEVGGAPWPNDVGLVKQVGDRAWADYNISLNATRLAGSKGYMVMFRVNGPNAYYVLFIGDNGNTKLRLCKATPSWKKRGLRAADHVIVTGENYTVNISVLGNNIKCFINGTKLIDYTDNSNPYLSGNIGLNVDYDSVFDFSNISAIGTNKTSTPFSWYEDFTSYPLRSNGYPEWTDIQGSLGDFTVRERDGIRVYRSTTENLRTTFDLGSWNRTREAQFRAWVKGMSAWNEGDKKHHGVFYINGYKLLERNWTGHSVWNAQATIPNWMLRVGTNVIEFDLPGNDGDNWDYQALDWMEIDLWRELNAYQDYIDLNYSAVYQGAGKHEFAIGNFSDPNIYGFKIYDYTKTERLVNPTISLVNTTYSYNFTDTITSGEDRYIIVTDGFELKPEKLERFNSRGLNSSENYYEYLLITHEGLYNNSDPNNPIRRLAEHREAFSGMNVTVITTQEIYDVFSNGLFDPTAIRNFLKFAYDNWTLQPSYVLFAGDTSSAFRLDKYRGTFNVPTHLDDYKGLINGVLASDNWLCCVSGDDSYPDLVPGRLPFASMQEAEVMVDKILTYDNTPNTDGWRRNTVFHADDTGEPWEYIFKRTCTEQIEYYLEPNGYIATQEAYLDDMTNAECKAKIKQGVNEGCIILQYSGHGSANGWASFGKGDIGALTNQDMYPFVMSMGCSTGTFDTPKSNSFCEEIVLAADKGGIASWGPSRTATSSIYYLFHSFDNSVFNHGNDIMGLECYNAIVNWADDYHLQIMTFFGDPAMNLGLPSVDFEVNTNYRYYERGEEIEVSGILDQPISGMVNITIRNPNMGLWQFNQTTITNGVFVDKFQIPSNAALGTYRIFAFAWNGSLHWDGMKFIDIELMNPGCNLLIGNENITYSPNKLVEGYEINISISVENLGTHESGNYDAWLYLNDPLEGNKISSTMGTSILRDTTGHISFNWIPDDVYADQNVYIVVDPEDRIDEFNEDDNKANITLFLLRTPIAYCGENVNSFRNVDILFSGKGSVAFYNKIQNYTWDFDDGTISYSLETKHNYSALGKYNVTLTVIDENDLMDTANITVTIQNKKPVAQFASSSTSGYVTTAFYFNSTSFDPDGRVVDHFWDFGDGSGNDLDATGQEVSHYFKSKGTFTVNLTVFDNDGGNSTYSQKITMGNLGPTAVIDVTEQVIGSGESIAFSAAQSIDPDDGLEVLNYTWVLDGDLIYSSNFTHKFALSGVYNISLEVIDPDGVVDTAYVDITVNNKPPVLNLSVTPSMGTIETEFLITADVYDPDGYLTGFYIDIGAEKVINQSLSDAPSNYLFEYKYNFKSNKDKTITAYAWDNFGTRCERQMAVITLENLLPKVELGEDMNNVLMNRRITFTPQVRDTDGEITKYEWDFDGDGVFDVETTEPTTRFQYTSPGTYSMVLRVTDNDNGVAEDMINITVVSNGKDGDDDTDESDGYSMDLSSIVVIIIIMVIVLIVAGYFVFVRRKRQQDDDESDEDLTFEPEEPAADVKEPVVAGEADENVTAEVEE